MLGKQLEITKHISVQIHGFNCRCQAKIVPRAVFRISVWLHTVCITGSPSGFVISFVTSVLYVLSGCILALATVTTTIYKETVVIFAVYTF